MTTDENRPDEPSPDRIHELRVARQAFASVVDQYQWAVYAKLAAKPGERGLSSETLDGMRAVCRLGFETYDRVLQELLTL